MTEIARLTNDKSVYDKKPRPAEKIFYGTIFLLSTAVIGLVIYFMGVILFRGLPQISWRFLSTAPSRSGIGILPGIVNTLYIVVFSLLLSVPIGVGGAIYLNEYARNKKLVKSIEFATETLAGIPSVLYGVFGFVVFARLFDFGVSLIAGIFTLTIMVLPIMIRTSQESLRSVPSAYREGALGMGATKWYMVRTVLLPSSLKGILTGTILSTGRMVSESAALLLVAGGSAMYMPRGGLFSQLAESGSTLSVELYRYAYSRGDNETAFGIAAVLMIIVMALNVLTRTVGRRFSQDNKAR